MSPTNGHLNSIQILRAVAALAVLAFHALAALADYFKVLPPNPFPAGADGVDIFFVISGFIMAHATARPDQRSPGQFAWKRIARILPLYWVLTLVLFALGRVAPEFLNSGESSMPELLKSLFFIPYERDNGVAAPILFLGWTLNLEMFFYAVFTMALVIAPRARLLVIAVILAALALLRPILGEQFGLFGFFYSNGIILEFVWGCLIFVIYDRWPGIVKMLSPVWIVGALVLLGQNFFHLDLPRQVGKGLPAALIVFGVLGLSVKRGMISDAFTRLGDASYSLYLGHPYAVFLFTYLGVALFGATPLGAIFMLVMSVSVSIGAALLSFSLLESPSNNWLRGLLLSRRASPQPSTTTSSKS